jgi:hypothetical protein
MVPPVTGSFAERTPRQLLELCRERAFSGWIEVRVPGHAIVIRLSSGEIETFGDLGGEVPESFYEWSEGEYVLHQQMVAFDGHLTDETELHGLLHEHWPLDVVHFCEDSGLTGSVELRCGLRHLEMQFEAGTLQAIQLGGRHDADIDEAWDWRIGEFIIRLRSIFEPAEIPAEGSGTHFLKVVEVALTKLLQAAEREGEATLPIPLVRRKARPKREQTVRIYYVFQDQMADPDPGRS